VPALVGEYPIFGDFSHFSLEFCVSQSHHDHHKSTSRSVNYWSNSMATVSEILAGKGMHLITVSSQASVYHAAILMNEQKIGSLLVLEEGRLPRA
jgi:hypothetical protein